MLRVPGAKPAFPLSSVQVSKFKLLNLSFSLPESLAQRKHHEICNRCVKIREKRIWASHVRTPQGAQTFCPLNNKNSLIICIQVLIELLNEDNGQEARGSSVACGQDTEMLKLLEYSMSISLGCRFLSCSFPIRKLPPPIVCFKSIPSVFHPVAGHRIVSVFIQLNCFLRPLFTLCL